MAKTIEPTVQELQPARRDEIEEAARQRRRAALSRWGWRIAGYVFFLALWDLASGTIMSDRILVPPVRIVQEIGEIFASGELFRQFGATLAKIGIGFAISFVVGTVIGLLTQNRWWESFFGDPVTATISTPGLVYALVAAIIFGFSPLGPIFAIVLASYSYVTVNVAEGVRALPKDLIAMARAFQVDELRRLRHVVLPHLAPFLFTGFRFGLSIAWKVTVLTEVFASNVGIGFQMRVQFQLFSMGGLLAWITTFFMFMLFLEKVVLQMIEQRYFRWRQAATL